jgi:DNA repair exonuclease SbcCD ATPase subunit
MINTTDFVQKLLKITPEVFQNCIAMTINNMTPFMAKKKIEKRKFIENIFNLEVFSLMNSTLKSEISEVKKEFDIKNAKHEEIKLSFNNLEQQSKNSEREKQNRKEILLSRLDQNNKDVEAITSKLNKIQLIDLTSVADKIKAAEVKVEEIVTKINSVGKDITSLETKRDFYSASLLKIGTDKDECPICLKPVTATDKSHIKDKKDELKLQIGEYEKEIDVLNGKLSVYEESKIKLQSAISQLKDIVEKQKLQGEQKKHLTQKQKDVKNYISTIEKDLVDLDKTTNDFSTIILEQKNKLENITKELDTIKNSMNVLDVVKFVLGEDGVRSYIVKKILLLFNSKLSYYLRKLNSNAFIKFDEYFEETIVNNNGVEVSYFNFSGAEKKVIDLAIMFTFIEMLKLQGNTIYNVQFYDELLDTSLDEAGVEMVVNLLNELVNSNNYGIYVISHRKECSKLSTGDIIFLEKKDGVTSRVEYVD